MTVPSLLRAFLRDPSELDFADRDGLRVADLAIEGCDARVVKYVAGDRIPMHYHTRPSVKAILRGSIAFENQDGPIGTGEDGTVYWCGGSIYRGHVLRDSYLLVIDELGSKRVNTDPQGE